jgi:adenylylsulfate kinase
MIKIIYISGLSGSGKTTIAKKLQEEIPNSILLDGDEIRNSINSDLGFTKEDKIENIRRNNDLIRLLYNQGFNIICAFMASIAEEREKIFADIPALKVQIDIPIDVCIKRNTKGLYSKNIENFAGMTSKYEPLLCPDIVLDTDMFSITECVNLVLDKYYNLKL